MAVLHVSQWHLYVAYGLILQLTITSLDTHCFDYYGPMRPGKNVIFQVCVPQNNVPCQGLISTFIPSHITFNCGFWF